MLISHKWLQEYFDDPLPSAADLADLLTRHAFEVEGVEKKNDDHVLDIDILPNRAHDCLSYRGIAREVCTLTGLPLKAELEYASAEGSGAELSLRVKEPSVCRRYIGRRIENIVIEDSPTWLREKLEVIGERSINNVVDITNFVMFDIGQPMHAFDADKVEGGIVVRKARGGEKITLLDGKEVELTSDVLVIADEKEPLAIAGVKGGKKAEVDRNTKNIIVESANFHPAEVRKTSRRLGILTGSSKRFENEITPAFAKEGMDRAVSLIFDLAGAGAARVGPSAEEYSMPDDPYHVEISLFDIQKILGMEITKKAVEEIFSRAKFEYTILDAEETSSDPQDARFRVTVPVERLDLRIKEDVIEEIARIYGYENIPEVALSKSAPPMVHTVVYYSNVIKNLLTTRGFSEVITYTFGEKGAVKVMNPAAEDKQALRSSLTPGLLSALEKNSYYAPLLGLDTKEVRIFEIGTVFREDGESLEFGCAVRIPRKMKKAEAHVDAILDETLEGLSGVLGVDVSAYVKEHVDGVVLLDLDALVAALPDPKEYGDVLNTAVGETKYATLSPYPFVTRDIAAFAPEGERAETIPAVVEEEASGLLVRSTLFDTFEKTFDDGTRRTSYAWRLVFQSHEKTLSDEEINVIMDAATKHLQEQGWEVR